MARGRHIGNQLPVQKVTKKYRLWVQHDKDDRSGVLRGSDRD